jgi:hypothetical protein
MTIIPFPRPPRRRFSHPVEPPSALGAEIAHLDPRPTEDELEDRRRMQQNLAALALVVVIVVLSAWMIERLRIYSRTLACIESGHRNCAVIDPRHLPGR